MNIKNNKGFTLIEVIISLFFLSITVLLLSLILQITSNVSKKFLDFTNYEYAMMHKKTTELYVNSNNVYIKNNKIYMENDETDTDHIIVFKENKIFKQTRNKGENTARGFSLLLDNIKKYELYTYKELEKEIILIKILDRNNKTRIMKLKLKNKNNKIFESSDSNGEKSNNKT